MLGGCLFRVESYLGVVGRLCVCFFPLVLLWRVGCVRLPLRVCRCIRCLRILSLSWGLLVLLGRGSRLRCPRSIAGPLFFLDLAVGLFLFLVLVAKVGC